MECECLNGSDCEIISDKFIAVFCSCPWKFVWHPSRNFTHQKDYMEYVILVSYFSNSYGMKEAYERVIHWDIAAIFILRLTIVFRGGG